MKKILIMLLLAGCSTVEPAKDNEPRWHASNQSGYYWRDTYNHRWGNAPPVQDIR